MSIVEQITNDLRVLPQDKQQAVADFVAFLKHRTDASQERQRRLDETAGFLSDEEAARWNQVIEDTFEVVEESP